VDPGHIRLYHQTTPDKLPGIRRRGLLLSQARGIEGPRAIYASTTPFYGRAEDHVTVEFQVPEDEFYPPFVVKPRDPRFAPEPAERVPPSAFIAIHEPWHAHARYMEKDPLLVEQILAGEHDDLAGKVPTYGPAIAYIKRRYR
jgi:hypothetical protein